MNSDKEKCSKRKGKKKEYTIYEKMINKLGRKKITRAQITLSLLGKERTPALFQSQKM